VNHDPVTPHDAKRTAEAHERQLKALNLRKSGLGYEKIAQQLGYADHSGAYRAVMAVLERREREPAERVRDLELERLDRMIEALWPRAEQGELAVMDRVLKIMERRAKYAGLDRPTPIALTSPDGTKEYGSEQPIIFADRLAALVALNERLRARGAGTSPVTADQSIHAPATNGAANGIPPDGSHQ